MIEEEFPAPPFIASLWMNDADKLLAEPWSIDGPYWHEDGDASDLISAGADRVGIVVPIKGCRSPSATLRILMVLRNVLPELAKVIEEADRRSDDEGIGLALNALEEKMRRMA